MPKLKLIIFENNQLKCYSDNNLIDTVYIDNVDEALIEDIVDAHFAEFEIKIDEKLEDYIDNDDLDYLIISL